ncbi:expressed unknown protein [Seminavis robusta]|uniref:Uncharacterized protein n=1 Tax=Seminavis robusta TaxID=568900 RepID=A0A9N8DRJ1_9STRA|nr:expressed unknown protein [Seminavis robusta]CAB9507756.1 expressed unknown protein [Seminavis robusta]|eukprot:Sro319_g116230.1 n/a (106) ;mRNA; r:28651-28968
MSSNTQEEKGSNGGDDKGSSDCDYDKRLDQELQVVRTLRMTMVSLLQNLQGARDDLVLLGDKMDRVRLASEKCRKAIMAKRKQEASAGLSHEETAPPPKRLRKDG